MVTTTIKFKAKKGDVGDFYVYWWEPENKIYDGALGNGGFKFDFY